MHRPVLLRDLNALSLDELMLSALYHDLIDRADRSGDRVTLWVGNQRLTAAEAEARRVLVEVFVRQPHLLAPPAPPTASN